MEVLLELYNAPYDPQEPVVCFDEHPVQLVSETRVALPAEPRQTQRYDYEYKREGTLQEFDPHLRQRSRMPLALLTRASVWFERGTRCRKANVST